jgi:hypothetical protein
VPNASSGGYVEWKSDDASRLFTAVNNDEPIPHDLIDQPA